MRLRLRIILAANILLSVVILLGLTEMAVHLTAQAYTGARIGIYLKFIFGLSVILTFLVPTRYYIFSVPILEYFSELLTVAFVRAVEFHAVFWSKYKLRPVSLQDLRESPGDVVYVSLMAIRDLHKTLKPQADGPGKALGDKLDPLARSDSSSRARPDLEYKKNVAAVRKIGRASILPWLFHRFLTA